jgi:hypothetical protein
VVTARCTFRGCPVRFRFGDDRPCRDHKADHQRDALAERMNRFAEVMAAPPGVPSTQADGTPDRQRVTANRSA